MSINRRILSLLGSLSLVLGCATSALAAPDHWDLKTADTQIALEVRGDAPVISRLKRTNGEFNWAREPMRVPLIAQVTVDGKKQATAWKFESSAFGRERRHADADVQQCSAESAFEVDLASATGRGPIEHWIEVENRTGETVTVPQQESLSLARLAAGKEAKVWWIRRGGGNASAEGGTFTDSLDVKYDRTLHSNSEDGRSPVPWLAVQVGEKRGLYVGWEFSGLGRIRATAADGGTALAVDIGNEPDFQTDIRPHTSLWIPPAFVGCYTGDIDEGCYQLHRFVLEKLRPPMPAGYADPTLAYNLFLDAGGNAAKEEDVLRCARTCHELGFETFMPDAMWFPETGDWRWDAARFPHGIDPIEKYVHGSGMKLALWCAWANGGVSPRTDALSILGPNGHPDWFRGDVAPNWHAGTYWGAQLCLGSPEAEKWAREKTQSLVANYHLDYLKHDMGLIVSSCTRTDHRHTHGTDASYWATLGYYDVQEKLRAAHPNVVLENCSGGGHIKDFGVIQRTHYTVTTDTLSNLPDRQSIYDSTFAFPPIVLQAYTYDNYYPAKGDEPGPFLWRSAMMSAWQIDPTDTATWSDGERDSARRAAVVYKAWVRPMLQDVKVHHILPRPDGKHWDGMFYYSDAIGRGMLYAFRPDAAEDSQTIRLKGLDADRRYWVWSEEGLLPPGKHSGADLMRAGLVISLARRYSSDLVYVQDASVVCRQTSRHRANSISLRRR